MNHEIPQLRLLNELHILRNTILFSGILIELDDESTPCVCSGDTPEVFQPLENGLYEDLPVTLIGAQVHTGDSSQYYIKAGATVPRKDLSLVKKGWANLVTFWSCGETSVPRLWFLHYVHEMKDDPFLYWRYEPIIGQQCFMSGKLTCEDALPRMSGGSITKIGGPL